MTSPLPAGPAGLGGYGAVDLGALAARARAAETGPAASPSGAPGLVIDVTEASFQAEVVDRSLTVPVVIDMWADWCGPCTTLSPILERLAAADGGRWILAKVDIEANQRIAAAFGVQSIPAVFAVLKGQPVPLFQGALPEQEVRAYLDELLRVAAENGVTGVASDAAETQVAPPPSPPVDPRLDEAYEAIERGDYAAAAAAYQALLDQSPADAEAKAGLLQVQLLARTEDVDPDVVLAAAQAAPQDVVAQRAAADVEVLIGQVDEAFARLVAVVRDTAADERDAVRTHLLDLFEVVGPEDPRVVAARRALARALY